MKAHNLEPLHQGQYEASAYLAGNIAERGDASATCIHHTDDPNEGQTERDLIEQMDSHAVVGFYRRRAGYVPTDHSLTPSLASEASSPSDSCAIESEDESSSRGAGRGSTGGTQTSAPLEQRDPPSDSSHSSSAIDQDATGVHSPLDDTKTFLLVLSVSRRGSNEL